MKATNNTIQQDLDDSLLRQWFSFIFGSANDILWYTMN